MNVGRRKLTDERSTCGGACGTGRFSEPPEFSLHVGPAAMMRARRRPSFQAWNADARERRGTNWWAVTLVLFSIAVLGLLAYLLIPLIDLGIGLRHVG